MRGQPLQLEAAGRALVAALQLVVEMQNALEIDLTFSLGPATASSPYERQRASERQVRFRREYVDVLSDRVLPRLLNVTAAALFPAPHAHEPKLLIEHIQRAAAVSGRILEQAAAERRDRLLLRELKSALVHALRPLEQADAWLSDDKRRARSGLWRCAAALRRYYR